MGCFSQILRQSKLRKERLYFGYGTVRMLSIMAGMLGQQELEAVGHIAFAVRKQRERKLVLCLLLYGMVLPTGLVGLPTSSTQSR